jgi:exosortase family protein XrtM
VTVAAAGAPVPQPHTRPARPRFAANWRFLATLAGIYWLLYLGYAAIPDQYLGEVVYYHGIVRPCQVMLAWLAPGEQVIAVRNQLQSAAASLSIVRGCDGSGALFLLIAAMLAMRMAWRRTLVGVCGATALIGGLNTLRIVALYGVAAHRPAWFVPLHVYFIPGAMILIGMLYFAFWALPDPRDGEPTPTA